MPFEFPPQRRNLGFVFLLVAAVCHLLKGISTNADYLTDGAAVLAIMNVIVR